MYNKKNWIEEKLQLFKDKIHKDCSKECKDIDDIREIIDYFNRCEFKYFSDYEEAIKYLFLVAQEITISDLEEEYKEKYLKAVSLGLRYAGEESEKGYAYNGKRTINLYASYLSYENIKFILDYNDRMQEEVFGNALRVKVIGWIILSCDFDEREMEMLKFRYIDAYIIGKKILSKYTGMLETLFSGFHYVERDESLNKVFYRKLQNDNNDNLYIKIEFCEMPEDMYLYISLSENDDADRMDYIWETQVIFRDNKIGIVHLTNREEVGKAQDFDDCRCYLDFTLDNTDTHQYDKYEDELTKLFPHEELKNEKFELIYVYGEDIFDLKPIEVYFKDDFYVKINESEINVSENKEKNKIPDDFFGKNIHGIHAVIGKNGMGKSSIFRLISECNIFDSQVKNEIGKYFIIYRLGNYFYYTNSTSRKVNPDIIFPYKVLLDINICLISNVYELFHSETETELPKQIVDLTTQTVIKNTGMEISDGEIRDKNPDDTPVKYFEIEKKRVENLKLCFQDDFRKFQFKDYNDITKLSSGEKARLILFARLLSIFHIEDSLKGQIPEVEKKENYVLMFDEAELYMHPSWQRRLIDDLVEFIDLINKKYNAFSNITILLSSNSPFLMSDLPESNIHFLGDINVEKTFGQNIYSILKNKFLMREGVVGSFAQKKIDRVFKLTERKPDDKMELNDDDWDYINYILDIIGDPLIKSLLEGRMP